MYKRDPSKGTNTVGELVLLSHPCPQGRGGWEIGLCKGVRRIPVLKAVFKVVSNIFHVKGQANINMFVQKLNGVGPVDNRPSTA